MFRTRLGERLPLGNKPPGQRIVGFPSVATGAGKRMPAIPSVTGAPPKSVSGANQAIPGKPSRGLATNFGARGIAPFRPGSTFATKLSIQPLTMRRSLAFLETRMPASESPQLPGFMPDIAAGGKTLDNGKPIGNGTMVKLSKSVRRKVNLSKVFPSG